MYQLIRALRLTNSSKEKVDFLRGYVRVSPHSGNIKDCLRLCYNPFINFYVKKVPKAPIGTGQVESMYYQFSFLTQNLTGRVFTGNRALAEIKLFLTGLTPEAQEVFTLILQKDLKCGIGVKTLYAAFGDDFCPEFKIQLANKYSDYVTKRKASDTAYWWGSAKLDGIRGLFINGGLYTRQGKHIEGFEEVERSCEDLCKRYKLTFIDGELFSPDLPFQTIQSYVMQKKNINAEHKALIKFHVFAVGYDYKKTEGMINFLNLLATQTISCIEILPQYKILNSEENIRKVTEEFTEAGYEGLMLRHPDIPYDCKRSDVLLKHKIFQEDDFTIVGTYEGEDALVGTLGGLYIEGSIEGEKIKSKCGSGFKILDTVPDNRAWFWTNRNNIIGKKVEVKHQGITDEPDKEGCYSLRFPIYRKLKEDR